MGFKTGAKFALAAVLLTGCSITLEGNKFSRKEACGPLASRKCAPTQGSPLPLTEQHKTIGVDPNTEYPDVLAYLGTVVGAENRRGEPGAVCGGGRSHVAGPADVLPQTYNRSVSLTYDLSSKIGGNIKSDIVQALRDSNVPDEVLDRVEADIESSATQVRQLQVSTNAYLREYQLAPSFLQRLGGAGPDQTLSTCYAQISSGEVRMYQAISGFYVKDATYSSNRVRELGAELAASIKAADPDADIASIGVNFERTAKRIVETSVSPYFIVVGTSFWVDPI